MLGGRDDDVVMFDIFAWGGQENLRMVHYDNKLSLLILGSYATTMFLITEFTVAAQGG